MGNKTSRGYLKMKKTVSVFMVFLGFLVYLVVVAVFITALMIMDQPTTTKMIYQAKHMKTSLKMNLF